MENVAIINVSNKTYMPSYQIYYYLNRNDYHIFFVYTYYIVIYQKEFSERLEAIKSNKDVVDIFCKSKHILPIIKLALKMKGKAIWKQNGV